jgi:O-succinylbenzoate synthase
MEICDYALASRGRLSPLAARRVFRGFLVRIDGGHGCVHPWPELGDASLEDEREALRSGRPLALGRRALACCRADAAARREGHSWWTGLAIPESHFTAGDEDGEVPPGFGAVKLKAGPDPEAAALRRTLEGLPGGLAIRIDLNGSLDGPESFLRWWDAMRPWHERIEFVEDPWPFDEAAWTEAAARSGCRFALDRWEGPARGDWIRVVKPALGPVPAVPPDTKLVFTSYLDHPVGQLFAAWEAAREATLHPARVLRCGLVTQHRYSPEDPFVASLGPPTPFLSPPSGTGMGWDDLLAALPWTPLLP